MGKGGYESFVFGIYNAVYCGILQLIDNNVLTLIGLIGMSNRLLSIDPPL
jgi:hypothetical protein